MSKIALYWDAAEDNGARCGLCPHRCYIADNGSGHCGVRQNRGGAVFASTYGVISSVALDPIEKKPLYMYRPDTRILSIGSYGCNLKCRFCQNYEISTDDRGTEDDNTPVPLSSLLRTAVQTVPEGNIGIAYTYNEPLIAYELLYDCASMVREAGLINVIVTNGYINQEPLLKLLPLIDAMNIDLKGFTEDFYRKVGGTLTPVLETIKTASKHCHVEVTTLVIPGENEDDVEPIAQWLSEINPGIPLHLSRFFPRYLYSDREPTPRETILRLRDAAKKHLKNVFAGNM